MNDGHGLQNLTNGVAAKVRRMEESQVKNGIEKYTLSDMQHVLDLIKSMIRPERNGVTYDKVSDEQAAQFVVTKLVSWRPYEIPYGTQLQWNIQWPSLQNTQPPAPLPPNVLGCSCEFSAWIPTGVVERYLLADISTRNPFVLTATFQSPSIFTGKVITITLPSTHVIVHVNSANVQPGLEESLRPLVSGFDQLRVDGSFNNAMTAVGGTILSGVISSFTGNLYNKPQASSLIKNQISMSSTGRINAMLYPDCALFNTGIVAYPLSQITGALFRTPNSAMFIQGSNLPPPFTLNSADFSMIATYQLKDHESPPYCVFPNVTGIYPGLEVYHVLYLWATSGVELLLCPNPGRTGMTPANYPALGTWTWAGVLLLNNNVPLSNLASNLSLCWEATSNVRLAVIQGINNGVIVVKGIGLAGLPLNSVQAQFVKTFVPMLPPNIDSELRQLADNDTFVELPRQWAVKLEGISPSYN